MSADKNLQSLQSLPSQTCSSRRLISVWSCLPSCQFEGGSPLSSIKDQSIETFPSLSLVQRVQHLVSPGVLRKTAPVQSPISSPIHSQIQTQRGIDSKDSIPLFCRVQRSYPMDSWWLHVSECVFVSFNSFLNVNLTRIESSLCEQTFSNPVFTNMTDFLIKWDFSLSISSLFKQFSEMKKYSRWNYPKRMYRSGYPRQPLVVPVNWQTRNQRCEAYEG
jgi:hypothetical protein